MLNAPILARDSGMHAALASESGRDFAIALAAEMAVAGTQQRADRQEEIKASITKSGDTVNAFTTAARSRDHTMDKLVGNSKRLRQLLGEISTAVAEQSDVVAQVGTAVGALDQMIHRSATLAKHTAAAASSLKD